MKRFSNSLKQLFVVSALLVSITYILLFSPSLGNFGQKAEADNLNITNVVMQYVKRYYVDKSVIDPKHMLIEGLGRLEQIVDQVLVDFPGGEDGGEFEVQVVDEKAVFDMSGVRDLDDVTKTMEQVFTFISPHMSPNDPEISEIEYSVLDKMLSSLDQHSSIITPQVYKEFMIETEGSFGGLGIVIGVRDGELTVISPIEGTPAYRIGIKPNDKIVQIENESTINMSLIEAVSKLRGRKGTEVSIHVMRDSFNSPREFKIVRDTIVIESVETFELDGGIKYVRIRDFQKNTLDSIIQNIKDDTDNARGMILDLRGNPGGLLDQAERISDLFLTSGVIVTTKIGNSAKRYHANDKDHQFGGNIVVLVDSGSASASEIVAGALKNNERAIVIGERTFGKGSVQQIFDLNDGSALKLTIAQYLTPGDISIQDVGVTPDIILHPAIINDELITFHPNPDNRLNKPDKKGKKESINLDKPTYSITYLDNRVIDNEGEPTPEEALSKEERRQKLEEDFYVSLAREIIQSSSEPSRNQSLGEIQVGITEISKKEENKIVDKWRLMGVDWSYEKVKPSKPSISVSVTPEKPQGKAGGEIEATVEVENTGTEPLYRLLATTKSENPVFEGKDLIFGKLNPGEKKSWSTKFEIPKWSLTRDDLVTLEFEDANKSSIPDFSFNLDTSGLDRPLYAFNYEIVDDGRYGSSGNGNSIPETGEKIALHVRVKNIGPGASEKTIISLKNNSGDNVFLEKGRAEIENLAPGGIKDASFIFSVNGPDSLIEVELQIMDDIFKEGLFSNLLIPENKPGADFSKEKLRVTVPGGNVFIRGGSFKEAPIIAMSETGAAFSSIGQNGKWIKINLDENRAGWIRSDKVRISKPLSSQGESDSALYQEIFEAPPIISVTGPPISTNSHIITLTGDVNDKDGIELVSVFLGEDKVALLPSTKTEVPVSLELKLENEINLITIIAKDSKGLLSKQSFVVRKEG
ncbi:MAG: MXAN_5808 family serine peptidase [Deltaproteobacteria bacterium]